MHLLEGRIALVTGALRGIGRASAIALAKQGARVIVTDVDDAADLADQIGGMYFRLDVTDEKAWVDAMAYAKAEAGGLDILLNNAGIWAYKPLVETSLAEWRKLQAINVEGVFLGCKHAVPLITERASRWSGGGSIINMSSVGGNIGAPNATNYNASKGAIRSLTKSLALELVDAKIRVNSVHPGFTATSLAEEAITSLSQMTGIGEAEALRQITSMNPMGRTADPDNIADGIVFLASDKAGFMTGAELVIDGGMTAQ